MRDATKQKVSNEPVSEEHNSSQDKNMDAFQFMMESRKKVIGSNSPGKELEASEDQSEDTPSKEAKAKRKLFLESWANKKGGESKKKKEENHNEFINEKLTKRKIKLKKMLQNKIKGKPNANNVRNGSPSIKKKDKSKVNGITKTVKNIIKHDDEFVNKLSSPLKKKEDMFSYFKKIETAEDITNSADVVSSDSEETLSQVKAKSDVEIKKRAKTEKTNLTNGDMSTSKGNEPRSEYKNGRPTRRCKNTVRYKSESEDVFVNGNNRRRLSLSKRRKKIVSTSSNDSDKVTVSSSSESDCSAPTQKSKSKDAILIEAVTSHKSNPPSKKIKLAPLFAKKLPKPLIDRDILEARQKFLYSTNEEVSDKLKKMEPTPEVEVILFPALVHVQQISENDAVWNLPKLPNIDILDIDDSINLPLDLKMLRSMNNYKENDKNFDYFNSLQTYEVREGLLALKNIYPKFPIYRTFKQLRQKFTTSQKEDENPLWTEKYKPLRSEDIVGNFRSVEVLKKWLSSWKECRQEMSQKSKHHDDSSDSEFWSDSDTNDSSRLPNNTYLVVGPIGSGKTSTIYAIANELDMNVLEVNASSRRTGKKMMTELQEATQSHKVLTEKDLETNKNEASKTVAKNHKKLVKSKRKRSKPVNSIKSLETNKMSLILIEDADIVFDEDDGFIAALNQIVQSSKRPVIIVTSDPKCQHLKKFASDNNVIKFHALSGDIVGPWLDTVIFMESGKICPWLGNSLVDHNNGDMRKTILQLQSWILGNRKQALDIDHIESVKVNVESHNEESSANLKDEDSNSAWDNDVETSQHKNLFEDIVQPSRKDKIVQSTLRYDPSLFNDIDSVANTLDTISTIHHIQSNNRIRSDDGFSLSQWGWLSNSLSELESGKKHAYDLSSYCESLIHLKDDLQNRPLSSSAQEPFFSDRQRQRWLKKQRSICSQLCEAVSLTSLLDRSSLSVDYLPYLRSICRSEKHRSNTNLKRNNRFYHYLASFYVDAKDSVFDDATKIFQKWTKNVEI
ncbi:enhanced level of genomic instability 1 [Arctopsyche grandis]|uniref:enhanced level of genomic instability 1 n=1 Tax=Arctopsyche grandis TaxID=121162 RepID=UPI00406DA4BB